MKLNKNLPSSLLLSLLCLNSCLFTPASYAADLGVADLAEEMAQTTLVRSVKVQGKFARISLVPAWRTTALENDKYVSEDPQLFKNVFGTSLGGGVGAYFAEPLQNLHIGGGVDVDLFYPNSKALTDKNRGVDNRGVDSNHKFRGFFTGLYEINSNLGLNLDVSWGGSVLATTNDPLNSLTGTGVLDVKFSWKFLSKLVGNIGVTYSMPAHFGSPTVLSDSNLGLKVCFAYLFDADIIEEVVVK